MRHLVALLVVVGCADPAAGPTVEVYPGPVATVTQGGLLQLAVRVVPAPAGAVTYDLAIDDPVAALFDVHTISATDGGAIVTLVPSCAALNGGTNGIVAMSVGAVGLDIPRATLAVDVVADLQGVCAGAPEHAITVANFQVANVPESGKVLCTRASLPKLADAQNLDRELLRLYGPTGATAGNDQLLCGATDVRLELWPPIDAPAIDMIKVSTIGCATDGCKGSASKCCEDPARTTDLTSSLLTVPIRSVSDYDKTVDPITLACADLDRDGTPEIISAGNMKTVAKIGAAGRFTNHLQPRVINLLGFPWQPDPLASHVEWTILGALGSDLVRAELVGGAVSWVIDPRLSFDTGSATPTPNAMLPVRTTPGAGATYVARIPYTDPDDPTQPQILVVTCISKACSADLQIHIDVGTVQPLALGIADYDGDGDEDFIVAYRDKILNAGGPNSVHLYAFAMDWTTSPPSWAAPHQLPTLTVPGLDVHIVGVPSVKCQRIYILSHGTWSSINEIIPQCGGMDPDHAMEIPTVNDVRWIADVDQRLVAATLLGVFDLENVGDNSLWRLQDPLLEEQLLGTGETLIDSSFRYAEEFAPCFASTPSVAFRTARGGFEWTELDARVETFSAGSSP